MNYCLAYGDIFVVAFFGAFIRLYLVARALFIVGSSVLLMQVNVQ
jgi:hypothetical protein